MEVTEIFTSIEGEGKRAGLLATFIRLFGCNLHCSYCDTRYSCEGDYHNTMSIDEIINCCKERGYKNVTITGGEPLIHKDIAELLNQLVLEGFEINVETNGTKKPIHFLAEHAYTNGSIFYTMDYKCPLSGMERYMNGDALIRLTKDDVIKFVVGSKQDLDRACKIITNFRPKAQVYFSPVFGKIEGSEIVQYMKEHKLSKCKMQLQMHKFIWPPEMKGV